MTRLTRTLLGETGFERAAVWSATGFALAFLALSTVAPAVASDPTPIAAVCVAVATVGVAGFARVGGGLLPSVLLAYGPVAGVLLALSGPDVRLVAGGGVAIPGTDGPVATTSALAEPLAFAIVGAVAVGGVGYAVGRGSVAATGRRNGSDAEPEPADD